MPVAVPAPPVTPCPHCGRPPSSTTLIGSDPPVMSDTHTFRRDHYQCKCAACRIGYRVGAIRTEPLGPQPVPGRPAGK